MHKSTLRSALRGTTATLAFCAVVAGSAAAAGAAPLRLEPATESSSAPVAEEYTSSGSSTISATVNAKIACLIFNGNFLC